MDEVRLPTPPPVVHAPLLHLPRPEAIRKIATVEYPAPVRSLDAAVRSLGGLARVSRALESDPPAAHPVELDLDPGNRTAHAIPSHVEQTRNVVCRVVKRRRKLPKRDEHGNILEDGVYSIEPVGLEHRLVRFRAMADYQYTPKRREPQDPTLDLADSLSSMKVEGIRDFVFPKPNEDFDEPAFLPPPAFSRHTLPQIFDLKPASGSVRAMGEAGTERLITLGRHKSRPMQSILFVQPDVPTKPEESLLKELGRTTHSALEQRMLELLEGRPVWTRSALLNQLSPEQNKFSRADKSCWPMVAYTFSDGPFKDLIVRFGYDPRKEREARFYQHIILRNVANVRQRAQPNTRSTAQANAARLRVNRDTPTADDSPAVTGDANQSHIFDGEHISGKVAHYQLCDISDPLIARLIRSEEGILSECSSDASEGWWARDYLDQIRQVIRRKWNALYNSGVGVDDDDCDDLLRLPLSRESRAAQSGRRYPVSAAAAEANPAGGGAKGKGRARSGSAASSQASGSGASGSGREDQQEDGEDDGEREGDAMDEDGASGSGSESGSGAASSAGKKKGARRASTAASASASASASATPKPRARRGAKPTAPWDQPKKKRPKAKVADSDADLQARVNSLSQQARRKSARFAVEATPGGEDDRGVGGSGL
ncbi:TFIIIC subunit 5 family protein [Rhodotorula paludigena]|uniref:TFIIIC subunit 5 family protein n=1 Tax=Rhodotorula paludigena TaxID=86838 RepID=UPI0031753D9C